jgi:hypothetical protein
MERFFALVLAPLLAIGACGGSTSDSSSGGTSSGGTSSGGTTSGGTGGSAGCGGGGAMDCIDTCAGHYVSPLCVSGTWICPQSTCDGGGGCAAGGGIDCVDQCTGDFYLPSCVNGGWVCDQSSPCPDGGTCAVDEVPTADGCLSCSDATTAYTNAIEAARIANAACNTETDCVLVDASTTCAGSCQLAVSQSGQSAFSASLQQIDADYCSGFVAVCGYSAAKCALPTPVCNAGTCGVVFN